MCILFCSLDDSVINSFSVDCFDNQPAGTCTAPASRVDTATGDIINFCCAISSMVNFKRQGDPSATCEACKFCLVN